MQKLNITALTYPLYKNLVYLVILVREIDRERLVHLSVILKSSVALATAAAKSHQSCPTRCDPIDSSPLGSSVPGIHQARILQWVVIEDPIIIGIAIHFATKYTLAALKQLFKDSAA